MDHIVIAKIVGGLEGKKLFAPLAAVLNRVARTVIMMRAEALNRMPKKTSENYNMTTHRRTTPPPAIAQRRRTTALAPLNPCPLCLTEMRVGKFNIANCPDCHLIYNLNRKEVSR